MDINELQNAAIEAATQHIKGQREENRMAKIKLYFLTAILCTLIVCASVVACFTIHAQQQTIIEQQYALNMQYASLMEYVANADVTRSEYTAQADGEGSISVAGYGNITAGGDVNGK